ncbi:MAG: peptidoglycan-associated lipoprotein Pal [Thermodesulfobacteriota bacterium]
MRKKNFVFCLSTTFLITSMLVFSGCAKKVVKMEEVKGVKGEEVLAEDVEGTEAPEPDVGNVVREAIEELLDFPSGPGIEEDNIKKGEKEIDIKISRLGEGSIGDGRDIGTGIGEIAGEVEGLSTVFFDYDMHSIRGDARETLKRNAKWLRNHPTAKVRIEGHADERGSNEYNLALGERRARSVEEYLKSLGLEGRFRTLSYGEEKPSCDEHSEGCWSRNRRAEFIIVSE